MYAGIAAAAVFVGLVVLMLNDTYGIGSKSIAAPQATLMSMVVKGVMTGELPWALVLVGVVLGVMVELMRIPVLPFALGLYLPIHLSSGILVGGILRSLVDRRFKNDEAQLKRQTEKGILLASGLVAGDALIGIIIAIFAALKERTGFDLAFGTNILPQITQKNWTAAILFFLFAVWVYTYTSKVDKA
jgi:putative OPT family oligopeptide transporter